MEVNELKQLLCEVLLSQNDRTVADTIEGISYCISDQGDPSVAGGLLSIANSLESISMSIDGLTNAISGLNAS